MNVNEYRAAVARSGLKNIDIADSLGITPAALWAKAKGKREFRVSEVKKLKNLLDLTWKEVNTIFFDV